MFKNIYKLKLPLKFCAATVCSAIAYKNFAHSNLDLTTHHAANYCRKFYPASSEYPDITRHRSIMARNLTLGMYAKLRDLRTRNGFNIDEAIQTGVDNVGTFSLTGCVAGDEETYEIFKELFDKVIFEKHQFNPETQKHTSDFNVNKLQETANFDEQYVVSTRIRTLRNIRGYCMPSFCTRGERRDVESILVKSLYNLDEVYNGTYYSLKDLTLEEEATLTSNNLYMERPYYPTEVSANLGKDWPDARGMWLSDDMTIAAYLNGRDHLQVNILDKSSNFKESFKKFSEFLRRIETSIRSEKWQFMHNERLGYLTTDPANLGTALKLTVRIKLTNLAKDGRLAALLKSLDLNSKYHVVKKKNESDDNASGDESDSVKNSVILEISSVPITLGQSEVQMAQEFANSINKLISTEKLIEAGGSLDEVLYST
jgi:creatine kinase